MKRDTLHSADQHQQISLLLPWYINQSLELAERKQVENHLRSCIRCRCELVALKKLAVAVKQSSDLEVAAEATFNALRDRLQTNEPRREQKIADMPKPGDNSKMCGVKASLSGGGAHRLQSFCALLGAKKVRLAIAASVLLTLIPVAVSYKQFPRTDDDYYTLSVVKPELTGESQLHVVFSKSMSDADINALLVQIHGQFIEGPNSVGAYTVRLDSGKDLHDLEAAIVFLRNQQDVVLAEPVFQP